MYQASIQKKFEIAGEKNFLLVSCAKHLRPLYLRDSFKDANYERLEINGSKVMIRRIHFEMQQLSFDFFLLSHKLFSEI